MEQIFLAELLQHYGMLLTKRQLEIAQLYYCDDLSLSEIADILSVSKQAVASSLSVVRADLEKYENNFHHLEISKRLISLHSLLSNFVRESSEPSLAASLKELADIIDLL